jgi:hypothetical protein
VAKTIKKSVERKAYDKKTLLLCLVFAFCGLTACNLFPEATINSPSHGSTFAIGENITFSGTATDVIDGNLTDSALVWTSSRDGRIGEGETFTKDDLSQGSHNIELTATNSSDRTTTACVTITVGDKDSSDGENKSGAKSYPFKIEYDHSIYFTFDDPSLEFESQEWITGMIPFNIDTTGIIDSNGGTATYILEGSGVIVLDDGMEFDYIQTGEGSARVVLHGELDGDLLTVTLEEDHSYSYEDTIKGRFYEYTETLDTEFHVTETLVFPWEDGYVIEETDDIATYRWILHLE